MCDFVTLLSQGRESRNPGVPAMLVAELEQGDPAWKTVSMGFGPPLQTSLTIRLNPGGHSRLMTPNWATAAGRAGGGTVLGSVSPFCWIQLGFPKEAKGDPHRDLW